MVCCITRGGPLEADLAEAGVPVRILHKRGRWDLRALFRIERTVREFQPDIVHTWLPTANLLGGLALRLLDRPTAWVISERAADVWKSRPRRWADRLLARRADRIMCNARALRDFLVGRGLPSDRIEVVYNGLDLEEFDRLASMPPAPLPEADGPVIATVARLEPQKGVGNLISAFRLVARRFPAARLWIVGDGPQKTSLVRQAVREGIGERVLFLGLRNDVPALLKRVDLFVLASLWEGLPNAVIEAMAAGRAVVATRVDGTPEAVSHEETGILVPPGDIGALAEGIARLLADEGLRARFGQAGRLRIARDFDMATMVSRTQQLYEEVILRRTAGRKR